MGVHQVGDSARLGEEAISVVNCQFGVEYLDGDLRSQVEGIILRWPSVT
jgi:hypothetical protein